MRAVFIILVVLLASAAIACDLEPLKQTGSSESTASSTRETDNAYEQPEWVGLFTKSEEVKAYRWYKGDNCPSGEYSHRDDLYIFDNDEVLSEVEIQARDPREKIIGTEGFHSTDGYICIALSESIHPSNYTALHELAHAIVYVEHGLIGHNKILDKKLVDLALQFDNVGCHTTDIRLISFIAWNEPLWPRIDLRNLHPTMTPPEQALFDFCYPPKTGKKTGESSTDDSGTANDSRQSSQGIPQSLPTIAPTPHLEATKSTLRAVDTHKRESLLATESAQGIDREATEYARSLESTRIAELPAPTEIPTPLPTPTQTPHPEIFCHEWEQDMMKWLKEGNNYGPTRWGRTATALRGQIYDRSGYNDDRKNFEELRGWDIPEHPIIQNNHGHCNTEFPTGRLIYDIPLPYKDDPTEKTTSVGSARFNLLSGTYEWRSVTKRGEPENPVYISVPGKYGCKLVAGGETHYLVVGSTLRVQVKEGERVSIVSCYQGFMKRVED